MKRLSISIAMCTYNGAPFIKDQLESLAAQARKPDEMVVCDDGSTDETVDIVEKFISQAPFPVLLIVNTKNMGATKNYEQAMAHCKGDVIAFADQDDVSRADRLQKIENIFIERPALGAVLSNSTVVDEKLQPLGYTLWQSIRFNDAERDLVRSGRAIDVLLRYNIASGATMAFNVGYKDLILPVPRGCLGDHWMALMCAAIGELGMIEEPLIKYRKCRGQLIGPYGDGSVSKSLVAEARKLMAKGSRYVMELRLRRAREIEDSVRLCWYAYDRLKDKGLLRDRPDVAREFEEKLAHLENRRKMAEKTRIYRLMPALRELIERRYRRYSNGIAYTLEDLLA
jgi:glycosyltransferase involved in cell wall biosynthesis